MKKICLLISLLIYSPLCFAEGIDIAIIGGGVAGVYTGYRLLQKEQPAQSIQLFEATGRIGGRLYTIYLPGMEDVAVELGGMRFSKDHTRVVQLAKELGLTISTFCGGQTNNLYYLRGKRLRKNELTDPAKLPYQLSPEEAGKTSNEIVAGAIEKLIPGFFQLREKEWEEKRATFKYQGKLLKDLSWINYLSSTLSSEAIQYLIDIGDLSIKSDLSLLSQLDLKAHQSEGGEYRINEGYQAIPLELGKRFSGKGGMIQLNHRLIQIEKSAENLYQLTFITEGERLLQIQAKKVILTLSPTALLHLTDSSTLLNTPTFRALLESVYPNVLTKLFLAYTSAWWKKLGLKEGSSVTSLPLRSCYYLCNNKEEGMGNALLLASYQGFFPTFWSSLNSDIPAHSAPLQVSFRVIDQAQWELKWLHGLADIPRPYAAAYFDWSVAPFYAAYYFWNVGFDSQEVIRQIRKPLAEEEIYIFSSDFSRFQGWVESALEIADQMLESYF